jgi:hypothetical protein
MVDARFVVSSALEYAKRRGGRLRAITIAVPSELAVERIREELHAAGCEDVELNQEPADNGLRLLAIEVE